MTHVVHKIFALNWKRKVFSVILATFLWLMVNQSLTSTRTLYNIPVRMVNIPPTATIEGVQANGRINKKINLTLVGNKEVLENLQPSDLEVVIDASNKPSEWLATITKKNIHSLNPEIDISSTINKVFHSNFLIHLSKLVTEKVPIVVVTPTGEVPRGYQFIDVFPYKLELSVSGPEEVLKKLRGKEIKLAFNLTEVYKKKLDAIAKEESGPTSIISFPVPDTWKYVNIPLISDAPIPINDPNAKNLRIDFIRRDLIDLEGPIPIQFIYHSSTLQKINPETISISTETAIQKNHGSYFLDTPLCAKGCDKRFIDIVKKNLVILVEVQPINSSNRLRWSTQLLNAQDLEDEYVEAISSESHEEDIRLLQQSRHEEYLRNRFRSYIHRFRLYLPNGEKLALTFDLENKQLVAKMDVPISNPIADTTNVSP